MVHIPNQRESVVARQILAARYEDGAQPLLVGHRTVGAIANQGVALLRRSLAGDLRELPLEIAVCVPGHVVVELSKLRDSELIVVCGDGVLSLVAEIQVRDDFAVITCSSSGQ